MRVMKYGHTLKRGDAPLPWLYRISDRYCFDILGKRRRLASTEERDRVFEARVDEAHARSPERMQLVAEVLGTCKERVQHIAVLFAVNIAAGVGVLLLWPTGSE